MDIEEIQPKGLPSNFGAREINSYEMHEDLRASKGRPKSSHRLHYEAQVQVIQRQIGSLENVREKLGLSQRKVAQLLMVDPSAWTRWTKRNESVPPHIYRALQWYMALQEKLPGLTPQYFIGKDPEILHQLTNQKINEVSREVTQLRGKLRRTGRVLWIMAGGWLTTAFFLWLALKP